LRRGCLAGGLTLALAGGALAGVATVPTSALAAAAPIALDGPQNGNDPLVSYDPVSGATFVAWSDPQGSVGGIDLCVLPAGAAGCLGGGPVLLNVSSAQNPAITGDNTIGLGGLVVLPNGGVVVIGTPVETGSVAWWSPPDGSAFLSASQGLQNIGGLISPVSLFYTFGNAVALSNTDVGLLDDYGDYFSDSSFAGPKSPAIASPNSNQGNGGLYPRKALSTSGPEIGAEAAPAPAPAGTEIVVGVGDNYAGPNTSLPGCVNSFGTGYGVSVGMVDGESHAAAGTLNQEGLPGYGLLACSAENPVIASGGISGAGSTYTMDYRSFTATATGGTFGGWVQLAQLTGAAGDIDVADDSGAGVYAMWSGNGLYIDYSPDGGANWDGPVLVQQPAVGEIDNPVIAGVGGGTLLLGYTNNLGTGTETFLQALNAIPPPTPTPVNVATAQTVGTTTGINLSIPAGTVGETDQATLSGTNVSTATGTVSYSLYKDSSCTGTPVFTSTTAVASGGAAASAAITTALSTGMYYWQAAYSGDALNDPGASTCGSEVLTVTPPATTGGTGTSTSTTVTVTITCAGPCTVTLTLTIPTASAARKSKKKPKPLTLAKGTFTLPKGGTHKLTLQLTKTGRKIFAAHHGRLKALLSLSEKIDGHTILSTKTIKIVPAKHKHKK
jgi:hypothetical protein